MTTFLEMSAMATWAFQNWPDIATLAFINVGLSLVRFGADFAHLFTGVMPALFSWFGSNWSQLFMTAASFVGNVFANIGKNIMAIMTAVWDFIASGGTKSLSLAWTPLLDGFKNTVAALPDIPPRAIGELEAVLAADSARLGESLGTSLGTAIDKNMKLLSDFQAAQAVAVEPTLASNEAGGEAGTVIEKASKKAVENKAAFVRSSEGQSVVQQFLKGFEKSDDQKKAANAAVASAASLKNIERDTRRGKQLEVRGFA